MTDNRTRQQQDADYQNDRVDPFYLGMLRQIAKQIGWPKLKRVVEELSRKEP